MKLYFLAVLSFVLIFSQDLFSASCGRTETLAKIREFRSSFNKYKDSDRTDLLMGLNKDFKAFHKKCKVPQWKITGTKISSIEEVLNKALIRVENKFSTLRKEVFGELELRGYDRDKYDSLINLVTNSHLKNSEEALNDVYKLTEEKLKIDRLNQSECSPVDLRDTLPEVRDQDSVGWCFGFVAADLVSQVTGKNISAADISLKFFQNSLHSYEKRNMPDAQNFWELFLSHESRVKERSRLAKQSGGMLTDSLWIMEALKKGYCLEENFPSEDMLYSDYLDLLGDVDRVFERASSPHSPIPLGQKSAQTETEAKVNECKSCKSLKKLFPTLDFVEVINKGDFLDPIEYMNSLADEACKPRVKAPIELSFLRAASSAEEPPTYEAASYMMSFIDSKLKKNKIVGVEYDSAILVDSDFNFEKINHGSSVVGRRLNPDTLQCEYLLRNSWGKSCSLYNEEFQCDSGNIWIPRHKIGMAIGAGVSIK